MTTRERDALEAPFKHSDMESLILKLSYRLLFYSTPKERSMNSEELYFRALKNLRVFARQHNLTNHTLAQHIQMLCDWATTSDVFQRREALCPEWIPLLICATPALAERTQTPTEIAILASGFLLGQSYHPNNTYNQIFSTAQDTLARWRARYKTLEKGLFMVQQVPNEQHCSSDFPCYGFFVEQDEDPPTLVIQKFNNVSLSVSGRISYNLFVRGVQVTYEHLSPLQQETVQWLYALCSMSTEKEHVNVANRVAIIAA